MFRFFKKSSPKVVKTEMVEKKYCCDKHHGVEEAQDAFENEKMAAYKKELENCPFMDFEYVPRTGPETEFEMEPIVKNEELELIDLIVSFEDSKPEYETSAL